MRTLQCFVIIPSNRPGGTYLIPDERWGLVEFPSGCGAPQDCNDAFAIDFDIVYHGIITESINRINAQYRDRDIEITCTRAQDLPKGGDILLDLIKDICTADITITDLTTHNPNVFFEYGIRLSVMDTLNIMICHDRTKLPFDVEQLRCIWYKTDIGAANRARDQIVRYLETYIEQRLKRDQDKSSDLYKRYVELHTGREFERQLLAAYQGSPVSDLAAFLFTREPQPTLRQSLFDFFRSLGQILERDPRGQRQAIDYYDQIVQIKGLNTEGQKEYYYKLWQLCNASALQDEAEQYLQQLRVLEEGDDA